MCTALSAKFPHKKPAAIAGWAGVLRRFAFEAAVGDLVIFPHKQDRTLNFGRLTGDYWYAPEDVLQPHHRSVTWLKCGVSRSLFSPSALTSSAQPRWRS